MGFAARPYSSGGIWPGYPKAGYVELGGPTRAWNHARERALEQLQSEAVDLGADAVVAVSFRRRLRGGRLGTVEFVVTGTAATTGREAFGEPMLNALKRLHTQRRGMGADGRIGVVYDQHVEPEEGEGHRLTVTLHISGTAISGPGTRKPSPRLALALE